jgi:hypothetical protein
MSIEVKMNMFAIADALAKNAKATRVTASDVLRLEMGQIGASLAKYTPPSANFSKQGGKDRDIGKKAIDRDMNKIFYQLDKAKDLKFIEKQNNPDLQVGRTESDLETFRNRYRRGGSVKFKAKTVKTIGDWTLTDQMYATKSRVKSFARKLHKHVGKLKSGWVATIKFFNGKMPAGWIANHAGKGNPIDKLDTATFTGYLGGVNSTPYAAIINKKGVIPFVVKLHQNMIDNKIKNVVGNAVRRFNALNPPANEVVKVA